jgi:hypothetical protein
MPVVAENGFFFQVSDREEGYAIGTTLTIDHEIATAFVSVHVGLSRVQGTTLGPLGAAVGVINFNGQDFGPDPAGWQTAAYGRAGVWTSAAQAIRGDISAWEFFQVWE